MRYASLASCKAGCSLPLSLLVIINTLLYMVRPLGICYAGL
jgi:hypothetical protein